MNGTSAIWSLSWAGLFLILFSLLAFKIVCVLLNAAIGRKTQTSAEMGTRSRGYLSISLLAIFSAVLVCVVFGIRAQRSKPSSVRVVAAAHSNGLKTVHQISEARQKASASVRMLTGIIPFDVPEKGDEADADEGIPVSSELKAKASQDVPVTTELPGSLSNQDAVEFPPTAHEPADVAAAEIESPANRKQRLTELASHIGPWIRSMLDSEAPDDPATVGGTAQAVESTDKKIVVFRLPGPIRQTYALIPLTPAIDAALSPMKPLLANGGLDAIAESLATFLKNAEEDSAASIVESPTPVIESPVPLESAPVIRAMPEWVHKPDGGRIVAETTPLLPGDDAQKPLAEAINRALVKHMSTITETLDPVLHKQVQFVSLQLDDSTVQRCTVDSYELLDTFDTETEGPKSFRVVYALVEFPESVDKAALEVIRHSVQMDRIVGVGLVIAFAWLSVCFTGCSIRLWNKSSFLRRGIAVPVFVGLALPLLLLAIGVASAAAGLTNGQSPRWPKAFSQKSVLIHVDDKA